MSLEDRLNAEQTFASAWRPEQDGPVIVGKLVKVDTKTGYNDVPYPILTLQLADGTQKAVHAFHFVLRDELSRQRPKIGEEIGIKYLGKPQGKNYEAYRLEIDRPEGESVDWAAMGQDAKIDARVAGYASDLPNDFPVSHAVANKDDDVPFHHEEFVSYEARRAHASRL